MSIHRAVQLAGPIPPDNAKQSDKKRYSELLSRELAFEIAEVLRQRAVFRKIAPSRPGQDNPRESPGQRLRTLRDQSPEKYFLGGFGRKKLDVSLADEQDGLLLAVSVKTITSRDVRSHNYNKNFKNRFGDLCSEATSVHMRSPYTVMCGVFAMPVEAAFDDTLKRKSTVVRAIKYLRSISGRVSHEQSPERFENLVFMLFEPEMDAAVHRPHGVAEVDIPEIASGPQTLHPYRLFDVWEQCELSIDEYAEKIERIFFARNPFLED